MNDTADSSGRPAGEDHKGTDPGQDVLLEPVGEPCSKVSVQRPALVADQAEMDIEWPGKGVDYYCYVAQEEYSVIYSKPTDWGNKRNRYSLNTPGLMLKANLQIRENDIDVTDHTGRFEWDAVAKREIVKTRYADIAPLTGNLGESNMGNMLRTSSVTQSGRWALSYGFYDSGSGIAGLTNQDQCYVYLTGERHAWMGDLAASMGTALTDKPFSVFALPGAHDAGMYDTACVSRLLNDIAFLTALAPAIGIRLSVLHFLASSVILRSVINLAFTQKDTVTVMLNLGVRYFDFRPGYCLQNLVSGVYHQHNFVPGYSYESFLREILEWLEGRPTEIVVVSANFQGFASESMKPSLTVLNECLTRAKQASGSSVAFGDRSDLAESYSTLLSEKRRLIFLNQVGAPNDARKYDSYSSQSYRTTSVGPILDALESMSKNGQVGNDYTVLQVQGTASGVSGGIFSSIATMSDASSPLMSTKPSFDNKTYPWLRANVPQRLSPTQLVVFLNDFCDNAFSEVAAEATRARATRGDAVKSVAATCDAAELRQFCCLDDAGALWHCSFPLNRPGTAWRPVAKSVHTDCGPKSAFACATTEQGVLYLFVIVSNKVLYAMRDASGNWSNTWQPVPSTFPHGTEPALSSIQCATDGKGQVHVTLLDTTGTMWHTLLKSRGSWQGNWGSVSDSFGARSHLACAGDSTGGLHVVAIAKTNGSQWYVYRNPDGAHWDPPAWTPLSEFVTPSKSMIDITCAVDSTDRLHVAGLDDGGALWHTLRESGGTWQRTWESVAGAVPHTRTFQVISAGAHTNLWLMGFTPSSENIFFTERHPDGSWYRGWFAIGGPPL